MLPPTPCSNGNHLLLPWSPLKWLLFSFNFLSQVPEMGLKPSASLWSLSTLSLFLKQRPNKTLLSWDVYFSAKLLSLLLYFNLLASSTSLTWGYGTWLIVFFSTLNLHQLDDFTIDLDNPSNNLDFYFLDALNTNGLFKTEFYKVPPMWIYYGPVILLLP